MHSSKRKKLFGNITVNGALLILVIVWTIPTFGLFISSFRDRVDIQTTGWWTVFPHRSWETTSTLDVKELNLDTNGVMDIKGAQGTFQELREGVTAPDGKTRVIWIGNKRIGRIEVQEYVWTTKWGFTLSNYQQVLGGKEFVYERPDGTTETVQGDNLWGSLWNSAAVTIPATIIPILIAAFAGYAFAWMNFPARRWFFIMVIALLVVPLQISLVPILRWYTWLGLSGEFLGLWLAHTGFGLPLATYLLYNYVRDLPREILESAFIDGASHFTIFTRLILPLSVPALASFAIFQFLWVWNDYLVALIFLGVTNSEVQVLTQRIAGLVGSRGADWHVLTAGAFISMVVPLIVFFSLQRYFVRGMMAGSVKG
jgi:alpha-glucoside transport system permease protein